MLFTVEEMELICVFHAGTFSGTLEALLRVAEEIESPVKKATAKSAIGKLSAMSAEDRVSLIFEPE